MMRATPSIFALSCLVFAGSVALAQTAPMPPMPSAPPKPPMAPMPPMPPMDHARMMAGHGMMDHAAIVQARQAGFHLTVAAFLGIKAGIARGADVKTLALPAAAIAGWGKAIPTMFPPGTDTPESDALPTVWSDRAGFETAAANMSAAARTLADLGKAGDTAGFATQFGALGKTCGACHKDYRKPEEKK